MKLSTVCYTHRDVRLTLKRPDGRHGYRTEITHNFVLLKNKKEALLQFGEDMVTIKLTIEEVTNGNHNSNTD